jgi:hypothetical protein
MPHLCHAEGCKTAVPPKLLMCSRHWKMVPGKLQQGVWATYRRGQEAGAAPVTSEYLAAADAAIKAVAGKEAVLRRARADLR